MAKMLKLIVSAVFVAVFAVESLAAAQPVQVPPRGGVNENNITCTLGSACKVSVPDWALVDPNTNWQQTVTVPPGGTVNVTLPPPKTIVRKEIVWRDRDCGQQSCPGCCSQQQSVAPPPPQPQRPFMDSLRHHLVLGLRGGVSRSWLPGVDGVGRDRLTGDALTGSVVLETPNFLAEGVGLEGAIGAGMLFLPESEYLVTAKVTGGLLLQLPRDFSLMIGYEFSVGATLTQTVLQSHSGLARIGYQVSPRLRADLALKKGWAVTLREVEPFHLEGQPAQPRMEQDEGQSTEAEMGLTWSW